ncbi:hypothetical protein OJ998_19960 [Solirubrobacter taibaiensis]|nr:hypothetical protein [Solirubrobacter taibaiensis]
MRRLLIGLVLLTAVCIVAVFIAARGDDDPKGDTERGAPGFPLRGSLAGDTEAIDSAVAAWREETAEDAEEEAEDEDEEDDDATRERHARRPDAGDDVAVLWIGRVDEREEVAILESQAGLLAALTRRDSSAGWFVRSERLRGEDDFRGSVPIGVGDAIVTPARNEWRYVDAGYSSSYQDVGDGLLWADGSVGADGFVLPERAVSDRIPIYVTGIGGRFVRPEAYEAFTEALESGYERAVFLAAEQAAEMVQEESDFVDDEPPALSVEWTGEVPGYEHAALVLHGDTTSPRRAVVVGYGDRPARSEEKDEGTIRLGSGGKPPYTGDPDTFAAGAYTAFDNFPYLILAGAGAVKTLHALVGTQEIDRKGPFAIIDARRFDEKERPDSVFFGRRADGVVVAPLG